MAAPSDRTDADALLTALVDDALITIEQRSRIEYMSNLVRVFANIREWEVADNVDFLVRMGRDAEETVADWEGLPAWFLWVAKAVRGTV